MTRLILVAVLTATQAVANGALVEEKIKAFDVEVRTPGVNLSGKMMYIKTDLDTCAYDGRIAFPMTIAGSKAFDVARELHREQELIGRLVYDVHKVIQTEEGPKDVCWGTNIRKP